MKTTMAINIVVACVVMTTFVLQGLDACTTPQYKAQVHNNLPAGTPLAIQCWKNGVDLGYNLLGPDNLYSLDICENLFKATKIRCQLNWGAKAAKLTLYDSNTSYMYCPSKTCLWSVREPGFYFNEFNTFNKKMGWS